MAHYLSSLLLRGQKDLSARTPWAFGLLIQESLLIFESECCRSTLQTARRMSAPGGSTMGEVMLCAQCLAPLNHLPGALPYGVPDELASGYLSSLIAPLTGPLEAVVVAAEVLDEVATLRELTWG